ncbi:hypothetical protein WR25_05107 isoform D [Diploscapter pachys]|uniref:Uncharacterized protein n=1 Tax=Diploscapter pachys TaxID=2018661 RepID=A0A2A2J811_9BILA|nr:hypothetical protein WR25_05107 isoform A [Diploscapter pachys]PAV57801.1 hypothetical protein WR25_05107 isoform B [Diploscapter pachys]PAV57802.1 hypothetical protein WR25_05107 isoform C [Diploscapter pachys]PAV57803.1 hypothetical protein WR25_05107 isoform D [Diploscapter pachys]
MEFFQMLGTTIDMDAGGLWLDDIIREKFRQEFITKYGIDASTNPRAWLRLLDESERIKKQMSANATNIPLNIECFMNDKDVTSGMCRADFEQLATPVFEKIHSLLLKLLEETGVNAQEVDEIEIVGGSSRIPMIRKIINNIFNKDPKTTMNQDEAVSRGAAMQCAILSPSFRVREFHMKDAQPYKIKITWNGGAAEGGESDVFAEREEFPFAKMVTLFRRDTFQVDARYAFPNMVPHSTSAIGSWRVTGVTPNPDGSARKVKVKVRLNPDGIFSVASATAYETQIVDEPAGPLTPAPGESMDQGQSPQDDAQQQQQNNGEEQAAQPEQPKGPKTKTIAIELNVEEHFPQNFDAQKFYEMEILMQRADEKEKKKADAKNSVEEYVYEMRDKLSDHYQDYVTAQDADSFRSQLTDTENWLYDEGEDTEQTVYEQRLSELKKYGDPIVERYREAEGRAPAFDRFTQTINRTRKAYDDYVAGGEAHAHIDSKDMEKVINAIEERQRWLMDARQRQDRRDKTQTPIVFVQEIQDQHNAFENVVNPILNKKKPAPPPPKKEEPPQPNQGAQSSGDASQTQDKMEVD